MAYLLKRAIMVAFYFFFFPEKHLFLFDMGGVYIRYDRILLGVGRGSRKDY